MVGRSTLTPGPGPGVERGSRYRHDTGSPIGDEGSARKEPTVSRDAGVPGSHPRERSRNLPDRLPTTATGSAVPLAAAGALVEPPGDAAPGG